ncbi:glycosyltransferase family 2 protein [Chloroflexota bacterium]
MTKKPARQKIIVGIPAFNEDQYIAGVILQSREYADEVIVIDDGSTDNTVKISQLAGAQIIKHDVNQGYGASIRTIISEADKRKTDILIILDADSQHDPNEIPLLVKAIRNGSDVVIGSREKDKGSIPRYRRLGQNVLSKFTNIAAQHNVVDTESGFRAYSSKAITTMELKETGMAISAEIVTEAAGKGLKITEVPISVRYTQDGSTLNPIVHGVGNLNRIMVMISERRPVLFFGGVGFLLITLGITAGILVIIGYNTSNILAMGWALITMLLVTVGVLCVFTGVILSVLTRRFINNSYG